MTRRKDFDLSEEEYIDLRGKLLTTPPPCFTDQEQWFEWRKLARTAGNVDYRNSYCEDCTPEFKAQMQKEDRCMWPCVTFGRDKDGDLVGTRQSLQKISAAQMTWLLRAK